MVAVVASILLMSFDHRANHLESARGLLSTVLYPLQLAIHLPIRTGEWLSEQLSMRRTILAENARLREERFRIRTRLEKLDALEADHAFLREGGVFTQDLIDTWLDYKRTVEADEVNLRPHPYEFMLYYDV